MERVVILGPGGAGKTELATTISRRTGLPVVHLDVLFWRHGWTLAPQEEALRAFAAAIAGERWILDGNFLAVESDDARFDRVDSRPPVTAAGHKAAAQREEPGLRPGWCARR